MGVVGHPLIISSDLNEFVSKLHYFMCNRYVNLRMDAILRSFSSVIFFLLYSRELKRSCRATYSHEHAIFAAV